MCHRSRSCGSVLGLRMKASGVQTVLRIDPNVDGCTTLAAVVHICVEPWISAHQLCCTSLEQSALPFVPIGHGAACHTKYIAIWILRNNATKLSFVRLARI